MRFPICEHFVASELERKVLDVSIQLAQLAETVMASRLNDESIIDRECALAVAGAYRYASDIVRKTLE